ncbi:MAG: hypothetical protein J6V05_01005 [Alistipes sp.]|nr:hypothetical protein [Alistipes sp.]
MGARKMTISKLLDSVPMGGLVVAYAPVAKVAQEVSRRNMARRGECYDILSFVDGKDRLAVVIYRREQWDNADANLLLQEQHRWQRMDNVWRA